MDHLRLFVVVAVVVRFSVVFTCHVTRYSAPACLKGKPRNE